MVDIMVSVATLIELLRELLDAEQVLFNNKRVRTLDEWLKKYLRVSHLISLSLSLLSLLQLVWICAAL